MKLYSLNGTTTVADENGTYEAGDDGALELPDDLGTQLYSTHLNGSPAWETAGERSQRLQDEDEARRRDPATALASLQAIQSALTNPTGSVAEAQAAVEKANAALADAQQAEAEEAQKAADDANAKSQQAAAEAAAKEAEKAAAKEQADADAAAQAKADEDAATKETEDRAAADAAAGAPTGAVEVPAGTLVERLAWVSEGEDYAARASRGNAVYLHELDSDPEVDKATLEAGVREAVYGPSAKEVTSDSNVGAINDYLTELQNAGEPDAYEAERQRLIETEKAQSSPRKGLVEGPHAEPAAAHDSLI